MGFSLERFMEELEVMLWDGTYSVKEILDFIEWNRQYAKNCGQLK